MEVFELAEVNGVGRGREKVGQDVGEVPGEGAAAQALPQAAPGGQTAFPPGGGRVGGGRDHATPLGGVVDPARKLCGYVLMCYTVQLFCSYKRKTLVYFACNIHVVILRRYQAL